MAKRRSDKMDRRQLIKNLAAASLVSNGIAGMKPIALAMSTVATSANSDAELNQENEWGNPVIDMHFHCRSTPKANHEHLRGAGISMAALLTVLPDQLDIGCDTRSAYPKQFILFGGVDDTKPDAMELLRIAVKQDIRGIGELSGFNIAINGQEMGRIYDFAAEMNAPVIVHFQDYASADGSHFFRDPVGFVRPQFKKLEEALRMHPKTTFIGHGPAFWGNLGPEGDSLNYPSGPVRPGGLTERLLSDYGNLYGGLDASSGINALHRDLNFAHRFIEKHSHKLIFGGDCMCTDGRGGTDKIYPPITQKMRDENPMVNLVVGKCLARVQLDQLKRLAEPSIFRRITWENGRRLLRLDS